MGAQLGDEVVYAEVGDLVFKPRGQWHTFWNAEDRPCRILELISPAGFERFLEQLIELDYEPSPDQLTEIAGPFGLEFDFGSVPLLVERHGLRYE